MEHNPKDSAESSKKPKKHIGELGALVVESDPTAKHTPEQLLEYLSKQTTGETLRSNKAHEARPKSQADRAASLRAVLNGKRIETLSRAELLHAADIILVDGTSLKRIYETHLVGEQGLRRLVAEYLRGGDLALAVRQEITEHEIDFERDPALRDMSPLQDSSLHTGAVDSQAALEHLLKRAAISLPAEPREEAVFYKAQAKHQATELQHHRQRRRLLDIIMFGMITVLSVALIALYLTRK